jgi:hypothetical protein
MSDLNCSPSTGNDEDATTRGDRLARLKWETPVLHRLSAQSAENSGNTGDDGPGASS